MRRTIPTLTLLALVAAAPAHAAGYDGVTVKQCQPALDPAARLATFEGSMTRVAHAARLEMRFALQTRSPGHPAWKTLSAPGFGEWLPSKPKVKGFVYDKQVGNLAAPAAYRTRVGFRWLDAKGKVVRTDTQTSPICRQPDMRPDLSIASIAVQPAKQAGKSRYAITVRNTGRSATATGFALGFSIAGAQQPPVTLLGLAAGARRTVTIVAPSCTHGQPLVAAADPGSAIDEASEANNTRTIACP